MLLQVFSCDPAVNFQFPRLTPACWGWGWGMGRSACGRRKTQETDSTSLFSGRVSRKKLVAFLEPLTFFCSLISLKKLLAQFVFAAVVCSFLIVLLFYLAFQVFLLSFYCSKYVPDGNFVYNIHSKMLVKYYFVSF